MPPELMLEVVESSVSAIVVLEINSQVGGGWGVGVGCGTTYVPPFYDR